MSVNSTRGGSQQLSVWDASSEPFPADSCVYLWNGHSANGNAYSLLQYCELHATRLRSKYLAWVHDIGEVYIDKKSVIDHLVLNDGLSYWWMTLLVEKSPYKSPLTDAIRLLALEEIIRGNNFVKVDLTSSNRLLGESVGLLCREVGIAYAWKKPPRSSRPLFGLATVFRKLPDRLQAVVSFVRYVWMHKPRPRKKCHWHAGDRALFFCSYFFNFSAEQVGLGVFRSRYWGGLHGLIAEMKLSGNWLHLYASHDAVPDVKSAEASIKSLNRSGDEEGVHALLEFYVSWAMALRVFKAWIRLNHLFWRLRGLEEELNRSGASTFLWSLMRHDWSKSLVGTFAVNNLWSIELFDAALRDIPREKQGFYLCENQSWERAFVHAWRKHGHGQLIAVPHSTVRFWDLRYFSDPRVLVSSGEHSMPRPGLTALNGKAALDAYLEAGYPEHEMAEAEALRFGHLNKLQSSERSTTQAGAPLRVLILGEYSSFSTLRLLQLLEMATPEISSLAFTMKPHPNYIVESENHPSLNLDVVTDPLETILGNFDLVYSGNMTSAAVDAYLVGLPVVVLLDQDELNFSPLRGRPGVCFVSTPDELKAGLLSVTNHVLTPRSQEEFFFLDTQYPRWKKLLEMSNNTGVA